MTVDCAGTFFAITLLFVAPLRAEVIDNWNVEGEHGQLEVSGTMTDSPCMMDMSSSFQEMDLGKINNAQLRKPGDKGPKAEFTFMLRHCIASDSRLLNQQNGTVTGSSDQPVMYVEFVSESDRYNPDLIQIKGIHGLGLRLKDEHNRAVHIGQLSAPQYLDGGQNLLRYSIALERTSEKLVLGPFHATVDFKIHYY
ncbi:fimbrial protein [Hafnia paralvei]|uniref:fimbrial protein n=1 Tax=Hafnia paralvei TaxID=546367 RepID=UPI0026DC3226|nr:fimbrial protein [Hafnia paralvei]MDX6910594.1 fimbrial protein [Hafnia paralvei]